MTMHDLPDRLDFLFLFFKESLYPTQGSNLQLRDRELLVPLTKPAGAPKTTVWVFVVVFVVLM